MSFQAIHAVMVLAPLQTHRRALIVTALPDEMSSVRAHLQHVGSCIGRVGHVYECGTFNSTGDPWLIVVCESGAGTHQAQGAVTAAAQDFGSFEIILFVGIAGARKPEISIGSVLASSMVYWAYSGKYSEQGFSSRPRSFDIDKHLLGIAKKVARDGIWPSRIKPLLNKSPPDPGDIPKPFPPECIVAPIVSVEAVSGDPDSELEQTISTHYGDAHAVEMEGYGALFAASQERTPAMVIRGISDKRAGKTATADKILQPIACMHASAFAFELLNYWGQGIARPAPASGLSSATMGSSGAPMQGAATAVIESTPSASTSSSIVSSQSTALPQVGSSGAIGTFVLNFSGTLADFDQQKIEQIVDYLKQCTGNSNLSLVKTEEGSVRLYVQGNESDRNALVIARDELQSRFGTILYGLRAETDSERYEAIEAELRRSSSQLLNWPKNLFDGTWLDRPELQRISEMSSNPDGSVIALTGDPGAGKSSLLSAFLGQLKYPALALKADLLDPFVSDEETLQKNLGLTLAPSEALLRLADFGPVFLIVDQIDALAAYIDIRTGRLSALLNLIRKVGRSRNVHVVLSSRTFEYMHDVRLRAVDAQTINLELPAWSEVAMVLERNSISPSQLPLDAQALLRSPQALNVFLELQSIRRQSTFINYQEMLDCLWNEAISGKTNGPKMLELVSDIASDMAAEESLWLPRARYDDRPDALNGLLAAKILSIHSANAGRIGFSHQTLFEHALARNFVRKEKSLAKFVLSREASLFIRPKLLAALQYIRSVSPKVYDRDLQEIWAAPKLRKHLRLLLIEFVGSQSDPTRAEFEVFRDFASVAANKSTAFFAVSGSAGWFELLADNLIAAEMNAEDGQSVVLGVLMSAWQFGHERVMSLLKKYWLPDPARDLLTWTVLRHAPTWDEAATDAARAIVRRTDIDIHSLDHAIGVIGYSHPSAAIAVLGEKLERNLELADKRASTEKDGAKARVYKDLLENAEDWAYLEALADSDCKRYLKVIWPWFIVVLGRMQVSRPESEFAELRYELPYDADFRFADEHSNLRLPELPILGGIRSAVEKLAKVDEAAFVAWYNDNESIPLMPVQRALAHGMVVKPLEYAQLALSFLLADARRLALGSIEDYCATTKRLVAAVSLHWSSDQSTQLEEAVLRYKPDLGAVSDRLRRRAILRVTAVVKREVLSSLGTIHTEAASKFVREQERRDARATLGVEYTGVRAVGSSMSASEMEKATDAQILGAFKLLPDSIEWNHPNDFGLGGNIQLSREFANFAQKNPDRARAIIVQMTPDIGTRAAGYALDAMGDELSMGAFEHCLTDLVARKFDSEEFRISVAGSIRRLLNRHLEATDAIVSILCQWQKNPIGKQAQESTDESADDAPTAAGAGKAVSVLWGYLGSRVLPGGSFPVVDSLLRILIGRGDYHSALGLLMEHLEQEKDLRVWTAITHYFRFLGGGEQAEVRKFFEALFDRFPNLVFTRDTAISMAYLRHTNFDVVELVLSKWADSKSAIWEQAYGELSALIVITAGDGDGLGRLLDHPNSAIRIGVTFTAVHLWNERPYRAASTHALCAIIPIANDETWNAISDFFRLNANIETDNYYLAILRTIRANISQASNIAPDPVAERLQTLLPEYPDVVAGIAYGMVQNWIKAKSAGRAVPSFYFAIGHLVDIAITLHRLGPATREIGTTLFDDLMEMNAEAARSTLSEIDDNRFLRASTFSQPLRLVNKYQRKQRIAG